MSVIGYTGNKLFLRSIIEKYSIRYNESFTFHEDEVFAYQYLQYIDKVIFTPDFGYHYEASDYHAKYGGDNFEPHYAVFSIIEQLHKKSPVTVTYEFYIKILCRSLFDSFLKKDIRCKDKLLRYYLILRKNPSVVGRFPLMQRIILSTYPNVAYIMLKLMAYVRRML